MNKNMMMMMAMMMMIIILVEGNQFNEHRSYKTLVCSITCSNDPKRQ
jgi:hypothetical protein